MAYKCFITGMSHNGAVVDGKTGISGSGGFVYNSATGEILFSDSAEAHVFLTGTGTGYIPLEYSDNLASIRSKLAQSMKEYGEDQYPEYDLSNVQFVWLDDRGLL